MKTSLKVSYRAAVLSKTDFAHFLPPTDFVHQVISYQGVPSCGSKCMMLLLQILK